jgi:hypothetical protein
MISLQPGGVVFLLNQLFSYKLIKVPDISREGNFLAELSLHFVKKDDPVLPLPFENEFEVNLSRKDVFLVILPKNDQKNENHSQA